LASCFSKRVAMARKCLSLLDQIAIAVEESAVIAKDFRDGRRSELIAVSVDMLSTGYNCRDVLNIGLMRPIFSPTEYIQIKGRGTRRYTFKFGNTEYEKRIYFLLDFL
jgi:type I site-specific restriction endonuclease